ncbi:thiamine phosphate synthase [Candidatus Pandoraea novymonadis]|uniref:Thiamine-phosphate synthase n=1 Tax=Candidatus Pandoraea novymonadis TaxID=1808959 RepID=A0ABX5FFD1_9BURK|nr:thiamine phosphate synthase [Candidatus Pandoraea novymonadis]PSB91867.1 Thiamine-phosphate synthase [Candidatus Pandoraea novymonadis]
MYSTSTTLPDHLLITPDPADAPDKEIFLINLSKALRRGIRLVQLRSRYLSVIEYMTFVEPILTLCHAHNAHLIINPPEDVGIRIVSDGIHLSVPRLLAAKKRPEGYLFVSGACHNKLQLTQAERIGLDFVTLSPVLSTATHPNAAPIGWKKFSHLANSTKVPIFALGGMTPKELARAKAAGAHGIAAIRGLWY